MPSCCSSWSACWASPGRSMAWWPHSRSRGSAPVVQSWIGTGQNLPISAAQLQQVLGNDMLGELAAKAGLQGPGRGLSPVELLPQVVDKLSPTGSLPLPKDLGGLLGLGGKLVR